MQSFAATILSCFSANAGGCDKAKEVNGVESIIHCMSCIMKRVGSAGCQKKKTHTYLALNWVHLLLLLGAPWHMQTFSVAYISSRLLPTASTASCWRLAQELPQQKKSVEGETLFSSIVCSCFSDTPALTLYWTTDLTSFSLSFVFHKLEVEPQLSVVIFLSYLNFVSKQVQLHCQPASKCGVQNVAAFLS